MDYRIVERPAFLLLGVADDAYKIDEVDPGFTDLWMRRFMEKHDLIRSHSVDGAYYGAWFDTHGMDIGTGTYVAGMIVNDSAMLPAGWVLHRVPSAVYAVFTSTLRDVGETTEYVLGQWLPASDYEQNPSAPRFDYMPPNTQGQDTPVEVWVPVVLG